MLSTLVAGSTASGEIVDIYQAAGLPKPSSTSWMLTSRTRPSLRLIRIWRSKRRAAVLTEEATRSTKGNVVRQRAFSERIS